MTLREVEVETRGRASIRHGSEEIILEVGPSAPASLEGQRQTIKDNEKNQMVILSH